MSLLRRHRSVCTEHPFGSRGDPLDRAGQIPGGVDMESGVIQLGGQPVADRSQLPRIGETLDDGHGVSGDLPVDGAAQALVGTEGDQSGGRIRCGPLDRKTFDCAVA